MPVVPVPRVHVRLSHSKRFRNVCDACCSFSVDGSSHNKGKFLKVVQLSHISWEDTTCGSVGITHDLCLFMGFVLATFPIAMESAS